MSATLAEAEVELKDLVIVLRAVNWHELGIQLNVPGYILTNIDVDYHHNSRKLSEVVKYWKRNNEASWEKVVKALGRIGGHRNIIAEIRSKYMGSAHVALSGRGPQLSSIHDSELASFQRAAVGESDRCVQFEHVVNFVHTYLYLKCVTVVVVVCVCVYVCVHVCLCICTCTCMCVCMYACYVYTSFKCTLFSLVKIFQECSGTQTLLLNTIIWNVNINTLLVVNRSLYSHITVMHTNDYHLVAKTNRN